MRFILTLLFCAGISVTSLAQTVEYASIKLEVKEDYNDVADNAALAAANTLLSKNIQLTDPSGSDEIVYLIRWMTGTPSYHFTMDKFETKLFDAHKNMTAIVLSAMVKFAIENKMDAKDTKALRAGMVNIILKYFEDQGIKTSGEVRKLKNAKEKGELEQYLSKL